MTSLQKATSFEPVITPGEAFKVEGFLHNRHIAEATFDADAERWERKHWIGSASGWCGCSAAFQLEGVIAWMRKIGCTRVEVSAVFDLKFYKGDK